MACPACRSLLRLARGAGAGHGRRPAGAAARYMLGLRPLAGPGPGRAGRHGVARRDRLGRLLPRRRARSGSCSASSTHRRSICSRSSRFWATSSKEGCSGRHHPAAERRSAAAVSAGGVGSTGGSPAVVRLIGHADCAVASLDRAGAFGPARPGSGFYAFYFAVRACGRRGQEGGALCLSPGFPSWSSPRTRRTISRTVWRSVELGRRASRGCRPGEPRRHPARSREREADVVIVRAFDDFASQRNCGAGGCLGRLGALDRCRRASRRPPWPSRCGG